MHPETFNLEQSTKNVKNVIAALTDFDNQVIFTASNADAKVENKPNYKEGSK